MPAVRLGNASIYYAGSGHGRPAVLFLHGSGSDHACWGKQRPYLTTSFTVAALDLNGHGKSPWRAGQGLQTYCQDALAVLAALDRPTVVAGHSLGGAVALELALQRPKHLAGLALVGTGARLRVLPALLQLLEDDFEGATDYLIGLLFQRSLPQEVERTRQQLLHNGQRVTLRDFQTCDRFDVSERLNAIDLPVCVCVGEQDQMTPVKYAQFMADRLPQATLHVVPDAGHMLMLEQAPSLNAILHTFLERISL